MRMPQIPPEQNAKSISSEVCGTNKMTPLIWNVLIVWCLGAIFAVEYCAMLLEREEASEQRANHPRSY